MGTNRLYMQFQKYLSIVICNLLLSRKTHGNHGWEMDFTNLTFGERPFLWGSLWRDLDLVSRGVFEKYHLVRCYLNDSKTYLSIHYKVKSDGLSCHLDKPWSRENQYYKLATNIFRMMKERFQNYQSSVVRTPQRYYRSHKLKFSTYRPLHSRLKESVVW